MKVVRLSTGAYAAGLRWSAWNDALRDLPIERATAVDGDPVYSSLVSRTARDGSRCAAIRGCRQTIEVLGRAALEGLWVVLIGHGLVRLDAATEPVGESRLVCGSTHTRCRLAISTDFEAVFLHFPRFALQRRTDRPELTIGGVAPRSPAADFAAGVAASLARVPEDIGRQFTTVSRRPW